MKAISIFIAFLAVFGIAMTSISSASAQGINPGVVYPFIQDSDEQTETEKENSEGLEWAIYTILIIGLLSILALVVLMFLPSRENKHHKISRQNSSDSEPVKYEEENCDFLDDTKWFPF